MYVVKYKDRVVLGIIPWNEKYITDVLRMRHREIVQLPVDEPETTVFPYVVNEHVTIYMAEENRPSNINPWIEQYYGPTWDFSNDKVVANYQVIPLALDDAKSNYKTIAANLRYKKEIAGTTIVINDTEFTLETDRESRKKYFEKMVTIGDNTINWKFIEGWVTLDRITLQSIVNAIELHVQNCFTEEFNFSNIIDACSSAEELLAIQELNTNKAI